MSNPAQIITVTRCGKTFRAARRTVAHLDYTLERLAREHPGASLRIIQPSFNTGVPASAGTHDYDACFDVEIVGLDWWAAQEFLRKCGWAAWYRFPPAFGKHLHMISLGYPGKVGIFVPGQVDDYYRHALGLKGQHNTDADRSWHPPNIAATVFDYDAWVTRHAPVRIEAANLAWQLGGDATALRTLAEKADVLILVECRKMTDAPLDVAKILGAGWLVQQDLTSSARAGSVTAVRKASGIKVRSSRLRLLSKAGKGVQARHQRITGLKHPDGTITEVNAAHAPLPSTGRVPQARARSRAWVAATRRRMDAAAARRRGVQRRWVWGGDCNANPADWAKTLGAPHFYGDRPMVICWSNGWGAVSTSKRRVAGSDHAVLVLATKES